MPLSEPRSASMYFMSILLSKYDGLFVWYSLRYKKNPYNPWRIPYASSPSIYRPNGNPTIRRFFNLYPWAIIKGIRAAYFGWRNKVTCIYGDLAYESIICVRVVAFLLNIPLFSSVHDDPINRLKLKNYPRWLIQLYDDSFNKTLLSSTKNATISDYMAEYYEDKYGIKSTTLFVGAIDQSTENHVHKIEVNNRNVFTIGSIGSIHCNRNWTKLVKAVKKLNNNESNYRYKILHIGDLDISKDDASIIDTTGYIVESEINSYIEKMDIGFLNWSFNPKYHTTSITSFPLKIHSYLSAQIPMIAFGPLNSSIVRFVNENNCGISCSKNDINELYNAINCVTINDDLMNDYKDGTTKLLKKYSREAFFQEFESFIEMN